MLKIRYNGRRFPRTVNLRGRRTPMSFLSNRTVIEFEDYDAYLILRGNTRLDLNRWEFNIVSEMPKKAAPEKVTPSKPSVEKPKQEKPKTKSKKKRGK